MMLMVPLPRLLTQTWLALSMASVRGAVPTGISLITAWVVASSTLTLSWSGLTTQTRGTGWWSKAMGLEACG